MLGVCEALSPVMGGFMAFDGNGGCGCGSIFARSVHRLERRRGRLPTPP